MVNYSNDLYFDKKNNDARLSNNDLAVQVFLWFPRVLRFWHWVKRWYFSMYLNMLIRSPRNLRVLWEVTSSKSFRSSGDRTPESLSSPVILFWTLSILLSSPWNSGLHSSIQYSKWGLTFNLNMLEINFEFLVIY